MPVFERAQKLRRSRSCIAPSCGRCPCCAGRVGAAGGFAVVNVPVTIQRQVRFSSTAEVPRIQFTARVVDILLCNRDWYEAFIRGVMVAVKGLLGVFFRFFRAPPGCPRVQRQFSEPSTAKSSSLLRALARFHAQHLSTLTFCLKDRVNKNNNNKGSNRFCVSFFLSRQSVEPMWSVPSAEHAAGTAKKNEKWKKRKNEKKKKN